MIHLEHIAQVWGVSGSLGGGKTLSAVQLAVWAISRRYFVLSNVRLNNDALKQEGFLQPERRWQYIDLETEDPSTWPTGSLRGSGGKKRVVVIIDECAEFFDQWSANKSSVNRLLSWLRHSSKLGQDVVLVVQRPEYLNKSVRLLVNRWIWVDDLRIWRVPKLRFRLWPLRGFCMQRVFDRHNELVAGPYLLNKRRWGAFYDTAQTLSVSGVGSKSVEYGLINEVRWLPYWWLWFGSLGLLLLCL